MDRTGGGEASDIVPPISRAEFKSHFLLGSEKIAEVLAELRFPRSPGRPADKDFVYMHDANGEPFLSGIPGCVGFVDGTFHGIHRPGRDGYQGLLQRLFYNWASLWPRIRAAPRLVLSEEKPNKGIALDREAWFNTHTSAYRIEVEHNIGNI